MRISIGNGGWVAAHDLGLPGPLYLRMSDRGGRLRIAEFYLDASEGADAIDSQDLRELPLSQLEAFINAYAEDVMFGAGVESPDLSTLASYYATSFGNKARQIAEGDWVVASFTAQWLQEGQGAVVTKAALLTAEDADKALAADPGLPRVKRVERVARPGKGWIGLRAKERDFRLTSGPTEGLTDDFLREVARGYGAAVIRGERPNVAIAEQTGYPLKSVQRWVYTARQRGIMPRGNKGKAG